MKKYPYDYLQTETMRPPGKQTPDFDELEATELYCPECKGSVPVRKSLLIVLPEGDKYEYRCQYCGATVGDKLDNSSKFNGILKIS